MVDDNRLGVTMTEIVKAIGTLRKGGLCPRRELRVGEPAKGNALWKPLSKRCVRLAWRVWRSQPCFLGALDAHHES